MPAVVFVKIELDDSRIHGTHAYLSGFSSVEDTSDS